MATKDAPVTEAERIEALEAQLARLITAEDGRKQQAEAEEVHTIPRAPQPTRYASEQAARQDRARQLRAEAHAEWSAAYEVQLERATPDVIKLEATLGGLDERRRELEAAHAAAIAQIVAEQRDVRSKLAKLQSPPVMPALGPVGTPRDTPAGWLFEQFGHAQAPPRGASRRVERRASV
jgi:hypothetical protein